MQRGVASVIRRVSGGQTKGDNVHVVSEQNDLVSGRFLLTRTCGLRQTQRRLMTAPMKFSINLLRVEESQNGSVWWLRFCSSKQFLGCIFAITSLSSSRYHLWSVLVCFFYKHE